MHEMLAACRRTGRRRL